MKRVCALIALLCLCVSLCACHARVDLTVDPFLPEGDPEPSTDAVVEDGDEFDEMAKWAWEIYAAAVEAEKDITTYDLTYEGKSTIGGKTAKTRARIVRVDRGEGVELLIQTDERQGYFKDGIGYFSTKDEAYWLPTDEEGFTEEMGFTESPALTEEAFGEALVTENEDGTLTVSCPISGSQATAYVADLLGIAVMGVEAKSVEECVTVDADGAPITYSTRVKAVVNYAGTVKVESTTTYTAVGDAVTLAPPDDLDRYTQAE